MNIISKLSISQFNQTQLEEINLIKDLYISIENDNGISDKLLKKKIMISDLFDMMIEHFSMSDIKLKYKDNDCFNDDNSIYINDLNENFNDIILKMVKDIIKFYLKYIDKIYKYIDEEMFKVVKLAVLNKNEDMIDTLANGIVYDLFKNSDYDFDVKPFKISKLDFTNLLIANSLRNKELLEDCLKYEVNNELSNYQIRNVFSCFSFDVFSKANSNQKAHLMNLVYNYFSNNMIDKRKEYKKVITNKYDNVNALSCVINDLCLKDENNHLNEIRNNKLFEDFKTGFHYIILNETKIENIDALANVSIKKIVKK